MARFDNKLKKIIRVPPKPCVDSPGWAEIDCGCCGGIQWGGESPRDCGTCQGNGRYYRHLRSGVLALYPGGPFI